MAASSAQREPSMEEILASIRRIIEDSDLGRKPEEGLGAVRPDNDSDPQPPAVAKTERQFPENIHELAAAKIIDVEAFRTELRTDAPIVESRKSVTLAEVQAQVVAERDAAKAAAQEDFGAGSASPLAPAAEEASETGASMIGQVWQHQAPKQDVWRLGVELPEPVAEIETPAMSENEALDLSLSDFDGLSEDAPPELPESTMADDTFNALRPALISDDAGKKVAASFSELSEAFAARSRKNLDEMAEEMLRPMLQDWLDNNLPLLVERLVREEIERVARG